MCPWLGSDTLFDLALIRLCCGSDPVRSIRPRPASGIAQSLTQPVRRFCKVSKKRIRESSEYRLFLRACDQELQKPMDRLLLRVRNECICDSSEAVSRLCFASHASGSRLGLGKRRIGAVSQFHTVGAAIPETCQDADRRFLTADPERAARLVLRACHQWVGNLLELQKHMDRQFGEIFES